jgi:hypothetical protein
VAAAASPASEHSVVRSDCLYPRVRIYRVCLLPERRKYRPSRGNVFHHKRIRAHFSVVTMWTPRSTLAPTSMKKPRSR